MEKVQQIFFIEREKKNVLKMISLGLSMGFMEFLRRAVIVMGDEIKRGNSDLIEKIKKVD